jgi:hypothetical protein
VRQVAAGVVSAGRVNRPRWWVNDPYAVRESGLALEFERD